MPINDERHLTLIKNDESDITFFCAIRFIVDTMEDVELLKVQFPQYNIKSRQYYKDKTKNVISIKLEDGLDLQPLEKYIQDYSGRLNHDFFISVSTGSDSEIIDVPDFVVECIRKIGGKVCFSFTSIS